MNNIESSTIINSSQNPSLNHRPITAAATPSNSTNSAVPAANSQNIQAKQTALASSSTSSSAPVNSYPAALFGSSNQQSNHQIANNQLNQTLSNMSLQSSSNLAATTATAASIGAGVAATSISSNSNNTPSSPPPVTPNSFQNNGVGSPSASSSSYTPMSPTVLSPTTNASNIFSISNNPGQVGCQILTCFRFTSILLLKPNKYVDRQINRVNTTRSERPTNTRLIENN